MKLCKKTKALPCFAPVKGIQGVATADDGGDGGDKKPQEAGWQGAAPRKAKIRGVGVVGTDTHQLKQLGEGRMDTLLLSTLSSSH